MDARTFAGRLTDVLINPALALLFAVALLVFAWGIVEFMWGLTSESDKDRKEHGKLHMLWGIIGMFVMVGAYAILQIIANTICTGGLSGCGK